MVKTRTENIPPPTTYLMSNMFPSEDGILLVLTGPFACGKTSIANALAERHGFEKCLTATTRPPRPGERDGIDYLFVSEEKFREMRYTDKAFLETARINGYFYGSLKAPIESGLSQGKRLVICMDPQGVASLMSEQNEHLHRSFVTYYIKVSLFDAVARFISRTPEFSRADLDRRIQTRIEEEKMKDICDCRIANPQGLFDETVDTLSRMCARRHKQLLTHV